MVPVFYIFRVFPVSLYSIRLSIEITTSISLALPTCALYISLKQLVNGTQFSKYYFFFILFGLVSTAAVFVTDIVLFTSM